MNPILISPKIDDDATVQMQLKQMKSYLFQFKEQMEMMLQNIDRENLSGTMVKDINTIRGGIRQYEVKINDFSSKIAQTENMISAKLSSDDVDAEFLLQRLNDGSTTALLKADRIDVEGVFTANKSFEVAENGDLTFKGAGINIDTDAATRDLIRLNSPSGYTLLKSGQLEQKVANPFNSSHMITFFETGSNYFRLTGYNSSTRNNPQYLRYSGTENVLTIGGNTMEEVRMCDGLETRKIKWTPLNSLTSDMYVLTDGGT